MLGLADRGRVLDLFDMVLKGEAAAALAELSEQYADGADPMAVLRDLAEIAHWVSVIKVTPDAAEDPTIGPDERARGLGMAEALPMRVLSRMWQMLLKAMEEVAMAPNAMMAAEMAVIRLTHVADLPAPEELVKKLQTDPPGPGGGGGGGGRAPRAAPAGRTEAQGTPAPTHAAPTGPVSSGSLAVRSETALARYATFEDVVELIRAQRDVKLLVEVETGLRLVSYAPGRIEVEPVPQAAPDLVGRLGAQLQRWTGARWVVSVGQGGAPTLSEVRDAEKAARHEEAAAHPLAMAVFQAFPGAKITNIRPPQELEAEAEADALPEVDEEWDPFEDD